MKGNTSKESPKIRASIIPELFIRHIKPILLNIRSPDEKYCSGDPDLETSGVI
jgi:hypothetical protein